MKAAALRGSGGFLRPGHIDLEYTGFSRIHIAFYFVYSLEHKEARI
jgi:hypothetical protein